MRFKKIYIEITDSCNLNCSFCSNAKRSGHFMSIEQFTHILTQIKPFTDYLYLHVLGEPLLHPNLSELLKCAEQKGFYVNLTTNATLLPLHIKHIEKHVRQVNMSLHADLNGSFPDYLQDCLRCGDLLAEQGIYISYRFWNHHQHQLDKNSEQMLKQIMKHYHVSEITSKQQKLADRRFLHLEEQFVWPSLEHSIISASGSCYGLRQQCAILCDGTVVPCCLDAKGACKLGNIYEEAFSKIINKQLAQDIVNGFQQHKVVAPLCQRCTYRMRFD